MREVCVKERKGILLGSCGEHLARCVVFDISTWQAAYGEGTVQLLARRSGDEQPYPCEVSVQGGTARWAVRNVDVAVAGEGSAELQYRVGEAVVKSETYRTLTMEALGEAGPVPPEPQQDWVDAVLQAATSAAESAQEARDVVGQAVAIGSNGNWILGGEDSGVPATGPRGEQGKRGETGFPAVVELSGAVQALALENNADYTCSDALTSLTLTGFAPDPEGKSEVWGIHFAAGDSITVTLPDSVVWNYGAFPVFTPGSEYWLLFSPMLNGKVLGVWNEVEA